MENRDRRNNKGCQIGNFFPHTTMQMQMMTMMNDDGGATGPGRGLRPFFTDASALNKKETCTARMKTQGPRKRDGMDSDDKNGGRRESDIHRWHEHERENKRNSCIRESTTRRSLRGRNIAMRQEGPLDGGVSHGGGGRGGAGAGRYRRDGFF